MSSRSKSVPLVPSLWELRINDDQMKLKYVKHHVLGDYWSIKTPNRGIQTIIIIPYNTIFQGDFYVLHIYFKKLNGNIRRNRDGQIIIIIQ